MSLHKSHVFIWRQKQLQQCSSIVQNFHFQEGRPTSRVCPLLSLLKTRTIFFTLTGGRFWLACLQQIFARVKPPCWRWKRHGGQAEHSALLAHYLFAMHRVRGGGRHLTPQYVNLWNWITIRNPLYSRERKTSQAVRILPPR